MADVQEDEEVRAARARLFTTTLNTPKNTRKRYSVAAPYARYHNRGNVGQFEEGANSSGKDTFVQSSSSNNPFTAKDDPTSVQGIPLERFGTNLIYRDVEEYDSLSKVKNFCVQLFPQPLRNALLPPYTLAQWKKFLFVHVPILHWLWTYRPKQLIGDTIAGITIGVTHVPQGIGFALLASLPPVFGLYSSFMPVLLYSILGSSKHISVGTFPVVALMTGDAISRLTHNLDICAVMDDGSNSTNSTIMTNSSNSSFLDPCDYSACQREQISIAITLSFLVGILMIIMSLLKLGFITLFLSDALVSGYTAAAAFTIFVTQIKFLFGLNSMEAAVQSGIASTPRRIIKYFELIFTGHVNWAAVVTSALCIILLLVIDYINKILRKRVKKFPIHIPAQLIVVILATLISYLAGLGQRFELPIISNLGGIPPGRCFGITHPDFGIADDIITDAIIIAIISFVINISQAKLLAKKNSYNVHPDQEFLAYGVMNFGGSFFGSFPTAGALSRTVLQDATGGHTQLVGIFSSVIIFFVIYFLGILFGPLPNAALAAIVVVALKGLYFQVRDIYKYFKLSRSDMLVWIVVFFSTLVIGLDVGLGMGVFFSIMVIVFRTVLPFSPQLGETRAWHYPKDQISDENFDEEELKVFRVPGIYIYQFNSPLYFANVSVFRSKLYIEFGKNPEELGPKMAQGCIEYGCTKMCQCCKSPKKRKKPRRGILSSTPLVNGEDEEDEENGSYSRYSDSDDEDDGVKGGAYHTIVIDCAPIGFADSMGVAMIEQVVRECDSIGVQVLLAAPTAPLCYALLRQLFFKRYSSERLFPTVSTAVAFARDGNRVSQLEQPLKPDKTLASNLERQLLYSARPTFLDDTPIELGHRGRSETVRVDRYVETESAV